MASVGAPTLMYPAGPCDASRSYPSGLPGSAATPTSTDENVSTRIPLPDVHQRIHRNALRPNQKTTKTLLQRASYFGHQPTREAGPGTINANDHPNLGVRGTVEMAYKPQTQYLSGQ